MKKEKTRLKLSSLGKVFAFGSLIKPPIFLTNND